MTKQKNKVRSSIFLNPRISKINLHSCSLLKRLKILLRFYFLEKQLSSREIIIVLVKSFTNISAALVSIFKQKAYKILYILCLILGSNCLKIFSNHRSRKRSIHLNILILVRESTYKKQLVPTCILTMYICKERKTRMNFSFFLMKLNQLRRF